MPENSKDASARIDYVLGDVGAQDRVGDVLPNAHVVVNVKIKRYRLNEYRYDIY